MKHSTIALFTSKLEDEAESDDYEDNKDEDEDEDAPPTLIMICMISSIISYISTLTIFICSIKYNNLNEDDYLIYYYCVSDISDECNTRDADVDAPNISDMSIRINYISNINYEGVNRDDASF